jgi:hypothetical protein
MKTTKRCFGALFMSKNSCLKSQSQRAVTRRQALDLYMVREVRAVLEQKGLDDYYIAVKMDLFKGVKSNLRALAYSRFLDTEGRILLAERIDVDYKQLQGFYDVSSRFS